MIEREKLVASPLFMVFLGAMMAVVPFAVDAYLPAMSLMADHFDTEMVQVNLTVSTYLIGHALGTFIGGALSDQLGRKPLGSLGLLVFSASALAIALAETISQVQFFRVTQAIGGGFAAIVCMAQVRDFYPAKEIPQRMATVMLVMLVAPMVAPLLGFMLMDFGWQTIFVMLSVYGLMLWYVFMFRIPESMDRPSVRLNVSALLANYHEVLVHREDGRLVASRYTLFSALQSGVFFSYLTNAMAIFTKHYSLTEFQFCLVFGLGGFCAIIGTIVAKRLMRHIVPMRVVSYGNWIHIVVLSATLFLASLGRVGVQEFIFALMVCVACSGGIRPTVAGVYMTFFDRTSGAAASLHSTSIFLLGGLIGALAALVSKSSLTPIFIIMLGASLAARAVLWTIKFDHSSTGNN